MNKDEFSDEEDIENLDLRKEKDKANMFCQLIAKRYENKPTIITTNQPF